MLIDAVSAKLAEAILARPGFADLIVKRVDEEVVKAANARVGSMIDRLLVERASETFAACDEAVELVRAETMRAARERVANSLPKPDDVRRESLAIVRDAVMEAMRPVVEKVAEATRGIGIGFDPIPASFPVPVPAVPQPATPIGCSGKTGCKCFNCDPPF
jgi:hypothetical protein